MHRVTRILGIVLALCAACLLALACASSPSSGKTPYKAGTYTATGSGVHGDVEVSVNFSNTAILEIKILKSEETQGLGDEALAKVSDEIIKGQSLDVDVVSGASMSSKALLDAVEGCVKKAGGDPAALKAKK
jgi:Uncharacterized protein conserved in bacteria